MKKIFALLIIALSLILVLPAEAKMTANAKARAAQSQADKCQLATTRVDNKITAFENNKPKHIAQYLAAKDRITKLVAKLKAEGFDTSKVEADLVTFNQLIAEFGVQYQKFIDALKLTETFPCGNSDGTFLAKLANARTQMQALRSATEDIKSFYTGTLKPDVLALRKQVSDKNSQKEE